MLKINLLPPYIHQRKQVKIATGVVVLLIAAEVGILVAARGGPMAERDRLNQDLQQKQAQVTALQAVGTESADVLGKEAGLAPKYDFLTGMLKYNRAYPDLYRRTAAYTYSEAMMLDLQAQGNTLSFNAYVSNPVHVSRLMLGLSRSPDFDGLPQIQGVPGFSAAEETQRQQQEEGATPGSEVIGGIMGAPGAMGGMPGMPGMPGSEGGYPGMEGGPGMAGAPGMPGMEGGPGMMSPPGMGGGYPGMPGMDGGPGMMGGGGGGNLEALGIAKARKKPKGFNVSVTCALKSPIPRPSYMSSDQQAGATGGGGGGMGMGGYPGMGGGPGMMSSPMAGPMPGGAGYP